MTIAVIPRESKKNSSEMPGGRKTVKFNNS